MEKIRTVTGRELNINDFELDQKERDDDGMFAHGLFGVTGVAKHIYPFKYIFGVEIENAKGIQISKSIETLGLSVNKKPDGTVSGYEYTTGLLSGDEGMNELERIMNLMKRHEYAFSTGTHVHVSNVQCRPALDMTFLISLLYKSLGEVRNKIIDVQRSSTAGYCKRFEITAININAEKTDRMLRTNLSNTVCSDRRDFRLRHTIRNPRIFGSLTSTVEFRFMEGNNDFKRLKSFILFISSLLDYFEKNQKRYRHLDQSLASNNGHMYKSIPNVDSIILNTDKLNHSMRKGIKKLMCNENN